MPVFNTTVMKIFLIILAFFSILKDTSAQDIIQAEYFIDTDAGFGQNTLVNVAAFTNGVFPLSVDVSGSTPGFHTLYVRTKDSNGKWSHTSRRTIEILKSQLKQVIAAGEYFFDEEPGFGAGTLITISPQDSLIMHSFNALATGLTPGFHKLYIRMKDNYGNWGITIRQNVEVIKSNGSSITLAEYFFDTDAGFGNCASVTFATPSPDGTFTFDIPSGQVPAGADTIFLRVKDSNGYWSITTIDSIGSRNLPLTLLSFTASKENNDLVQLNWVTTNELNTSHFIIERSTDGTHFTNTGKVNAQGNSSSNKNYNFTDNIAALIPGKIFYRLLMADRDGKFTYSGIKIIEKPNELSITLNPNPVITNTINLRIHNNRREKIQLNIFSTLGKKVYSQQMETLQGSINKSINVMNLPAGTYIVQVLHNAGITSCKMIKK